MFKRLFATYDDIKTRREDGEGGFTLIELLVVVVIIGILVAIAIPLYLNYTQGAKNNSLSSDVRNAVVSVNQCIAANNQNLPTSPTTFTSGASGVHQFAGTPAPCSNVNVVVSSGTSTLTYTYYPAQAATTGATPTAATSAYYTLKASDGVTGGVNETYNSNTGNITQGTN